MAYVEPMRKISQIRRYVSKVKDNAGGEGREEEEEEEGNAIILDTTEGSQISAASGRLTLGENFVHLKDLGTGNAKRSGGIRLVLSIEISMADMSIDLVRSPVFRVQNQRRSSVD